MRPTVFQKAELRDENDNIIQQGTYGKGSALSNSTNDGWIDYVMNNLEALYGIAKDEVVPVSTLPASGDMNKTYLLTTNGKTYRWSGTEWIELTNSEAVGRAENAATLAEQWATKTDGAVADNEYSAKYYSNVSKDWANKLNATVDGSEYSAKYYANAAQQSADDAQDVADDMADHLAQIDQNTGGVSANSKRIGNIEKLLQGNLYDYDTDDDTAYIKSVPAGAMPYAGLEKIGGKTVVWNQMVDSGTTSVPTISGHKYYTLIDGTASIVTADGTAITIVDDTADMVCDLTLMFGMGDEPSTTADFTAIFGATHYEYNAGELLSAGVTDVVSKDGNNATLQTYSIPASIQALEGYGWSAGSVYNYIDYERKVFVQNVGKIILNGTQSISVVNWNADSTGVGWVYSYSLTNNKVPSNSEAGNLVSDKFVTKSNGQMNGWSGTDKNGIGFSSNTIYGLQIRTPDTSLTTATAINAYLSANPITVYYELATPQETDISEYLTDDNLIEVESSGTITFPNQNGTDYQIPVPSEEEYMIDLQEAINNG